MSGAGFDWQFLVVTIAAACGGWFLLRPLWQFRGSGGAPKAGGACGHCSSPDCAKQPVPGATGLVQLGSGAPRKPGSFAGAPPEAGA